jgi:hypothetical protein
VLPGTSTSSRHHLHHSFLLCSRISLRCCGVTSHVAPCRFCVCSLQQRRHLTCLFQSRAAQYTWRSWVVTGAAQAGASAPVSTFHTCSLRAQSAQRRAPFGQHLARLLTQFTTLESNRRPATAPDSTHEAHTARTGTDCVARSPAAASQPLPIAPWRPVPVPSRTIAVSTKRPRAKSQRGVLPLTLLVCTNSNSSACSRHAGPVPAGRVWVLPAGMGQERGGGAVPGGTRARLALQGKCFDWR